MTTNFIGCSVHQTGGQNANVIFWVTKHQRHGGHFGNSAVMQKLALLRHLKCNYSLRLLLWVLVFRTSSCKLTFSFRGQATYTHSKKKKLRYWNLQANRGDKVALKRLDSQSQSSAISVQKERIARLSCREQGRAAWYVPAFVICRSAHEQIISKPLTWLSIPSMSSIEKNRMAQRGDTGNWVTASG